MMDLDKINTWSREALVCSIVFHRLGFKHEQVGAGVDGNGNTFVSLHHGGEQYNIVLGKTEDIADSKFVGEWKEAVQAVINNNICRIRLEEICQRSVTWPKVGEIVLALAERRFLNV
tara:strand:+ start:17844 stop:18194 length:351 start_codon:yes stop_codon:yes gene_type:complete